MHIVIGILGVVGALMYYFFFFKRAGEAAGEAVDMAQRVRGKMRRNAFRKKAEGSTLTSISDAGTAAMVLLAKVAEQKKPVSETVQTELVRIAEEEIGIEDGEEATVFAQWVAGEAVNPEDIIRRFRTIWLEQLTPAQVKDFANLAGTIAGVDEPANAQQKYIIDQLKERLGLSG